MNDYYEKYEKLDVKPPREAIQDQTDKKPVILPSAASTLSNIANSKVNIFKQGCGSGSARIRIFLSPRIRIRILGYKFKEKST